MKSRTRLQANKSIKYEHTHMRMYVCIHIHTCVTQSTVREESWCDFCWFRARSLSSSFFSTASVRCKVSRSTTTALKCSESTVGLLLLLGVASLHGGGAVHLLIAEMRLRNCTSTSAQSASSALLASTSVTKEAGAETSPPAATSLDIAASRHTTTITQSLSGLKAAVFQAKLGT